MKRALLLVVTVVLAGSMMACLPPVRVDPIVEIETYETAFLVPLEGATEDQANFMSIIYLENNKLATKRFVVPQRPRKIGRGWWKIEWVPTMRVVTVDRRPITREWTSEVGTGTSRERQAIAVESLESIGFSVGVNITVRVDEENTPRFLYYYPGKSLAEITDSNIRGFIQAFLSREFGSRPLEECKVEKKEIFDALLTATAEHFSGYGITITTLGFSDGLFYDSKGIQTAIDAVQEAEMSVLVEEQKRLRQEVENRLLIEISEAQVRVAINERLAAEEFGKARIAWEAKIELEIRRILAEKWNGAYPANILPEGSNLLMTIK